MTSPVPSPAPAIALASFRPARWLANPHLQTLTPRLLRPRTLGWRSEWFDLPDGDEVELSWVTPEPPSPTAPLFVLFHGLEGSIASPYARDLLGAAKDMGYRALLMHFRGCGARPNRRPRAYHSGDTGDARVLFEALLERYPEAPRFACGVSLGGNMLLKLVAEPEVDALGLSGAIAISAPLDLAACAERLGQGFSRVYERHLLGSLKRKVVERLKCGELPLTVDARTVSRLKRLRDYDDVVTAPLHGFKDAADYYAKASSGPVLGNIRVPTLLLHAADDPFMPADIIDRFPERSSLLHMEVARNGGHVGFMERRGSRLEPWLGRRVGDQLKTWRDELGGPAFPQPESP
ncbi:hydrolase [Halomonas sp. V046]|uniref:hydrolase n=1 Tax=Halomonas sp. V046 TaxID=3459611 RepID=UPI00404461C8